MKNKTCFEEMFEQSLIQNGDRYPDEYADNYYSKSKAAHELGKCDKCTGGDGVPKNIYRTWHKAFETASFIYSERGIDLKVYSCKEGNGWHLTKSH